jgi:hypothetical protein
MMVEQQLTHCSINNVNIKLLLNLVIRVNL